MTTLKRNPKNKTDKDVFRRLFNKEFKPDNFAALWKVIRRYDEYKLKKLLRKIKA